MRLFDLSPIKRDGMEAVVTGRDIAATESIARALDVDWCQDTLEKFYILHNDWLRSEIRAQEARARTRELKQGPR